MQGLPASRQTQILRLLPRVGYRFGFALRQRGAWDWADKADFMDLRGLPATFNWFYCVFKNIKMAVRP